MSHVMKSLKRGHLVSDGHFACGGGVFRLTRYIWISYCNQFPVQIKTVKTVGRRIIYHLVGRGSITVLNALPGKCVDISVVVTTSVVVGASLVTVVVVGACVTVVVLGGG